MGYLVFTIWKTWGEIKYLTSSMVKGLRPYDLSVKHYVYIYTLL